MRSLEAERKLAETRREPTAVFRSTLSAALGGNDELMARCKSCVERSGDLREPGSGFVFGFLPTGRRPTDRCFGAPSWCCGELSGCGWHGQFRDEAVEAWIDKEARQWTSVSTKNQSQHLEPRTGMFPEVECTPDRNPAFKKKPGFEKVGSQGATTWSCAPSELEQATRDGLQRQNRQALRKPNHAKDHQNRGITSPRRTQSSPRFTSTTKSGALTPQPRY
jgi:hypothetical protein